MNDQALFLLNIFNQRTALSLDDLAVITDTSQFALLDAINYLRRQDCIRVCGVTKPVSKDEPLPPLELGTKMKITPWGKDALKKEQREKIGDLRAWIAIGISCVSLVLSIISIVMQQY